MFNFYRGYTVVGNVIVCSFNASTTNFLRREFGSKIWDTLDDIRAYRRIGWDKHKIAQDRLKRAQKAQRAQHIQNNRRK